LQKGRNPLLSSRLTYFRALRVLGVGLFFASLFRYQSVSRSIFGLWSYSFSFLILATGSFLLFTIIRSRQALRASNSNAEFLPSGMGELVDVAVLAWGLAYFLDVHEASENAPRILELNLFGSVMPAASLLEWIALVALFMAGVAFVIHKVDRKWANTALVIGTTLVLALLLEGILRIRVIVNPLPQGFPTISTQAWFRRYVKLNHDGFRDQDHTLVRQPGNQRLLVVGDSFAFGAGVPRIENRLGEQLAALLGKRTGKRWEVATAAVGGADTMDEIQFLQRVTFADPDVVLLIYFFNDIDYLLELPRRTPGTLIETYYPRWLLFKNFLLYQELYIRYRLIRRSLLATDPITSSAYRDASLVSAHMADLERFVHIASQRGALVKVVPFDNTILASPELRERDTAFVLQLQARGIPVCPLLDTFDGFAFRDLAVNAPFDGHPNEKAHSLAAAAVADCLAAEEPQ